MRNEMNLNISWLSDKDTAVCSLLLRISLTVHIKYFCVSNEIFVIFLVASNEIHTIRTAVACLTSAQAIHMVSPV